MPSEKFWHEIFSSENVATEIFHANYLELKSTQTKIKQITVVSFQCVKAKNGAQPTQILEDLTFAQS